MANLPSLWKEHFSSSPFKEMSNFQNRIDRMMNELLELKGQSPSGTMDFSPSSEITEEENQYLLKVDLPGVKKEDVKVEVSGDTMTIKAERKTEKEEKSKKRFLSEISYGSYIRSFSLPQSIDEKKVDAKFENGVLQITIPKTETSKSKQISVH
ncbi:Hsp20/alpha crystallin family protein [Bdellovibrio sp. NC01]|uniref:Hsp20/alpha crystallin family protein n=1 Tax=Bdellovibrio sp. NC01 TaxID=2220073 RepID=UPI001157135B|nr:Hsp20/alpha crystallin family protein [Bdellovibrio sp. NC01]QDK36459.1 Hsp20/alpha crystallin family protein [Bdellovibrio sp. NC01]